MAMDLPATSIPLWAAEDLPFATHCQECGGVPCGSQATVIIAVGATQLTSPTSVEPARKASPVK